MAVVNFPAGFSYQLQNSGQFTTGSDVRSGNSETFRVEISGTQLAAALNVPPTSSVSVASANPTSDPRQGAVVISSGFGPAVTGTQTGYQTQNAISIQLDPNQSLTGTLVISNSFVSQGQQFSLVNDSPETFQNLQVVCFAQGTRILTVDGEVAVEDLREGDVVVTATGEHRPITWIGHRRVDCARHPQPEAVLPIRVLKDAFGEGLPRRDLFLSPDHSIRVSVLDEVLIPIKHLINDATIAQVSVEAVTYWHVELDSHDILVAEGLPAESFLDTGVRCFFANEGSFTTLHPDFAPLTLADFCRPLVQEGPIVDAVRIRLLARAEALGWRFTTDDDLHLLVDGSVISPEREGTTARFRLPAEARKVRLVSRSFVPERVRVGAGDGRRLGVPMRGVSVQEASGVTRVLPIDHPLFVDGFSFVQWHGAEAWRWTDGDAVLPAVLWAGATGEVVLLIETAPEHGQLMAWLAPTFTVEVDRTQDVSLPQVA